MKVCYETECEKFEVLESWNSFRTLFDLASAFEPLVVLMYYRLAISIHKRID